ncbi:hypothetical protein BHE74_00042896 [Ensete ventricosum]|nr:hypothetical protein BHE74_00042896 [Ensete ventricosum]
MRHRTPLSTRLPLRVRKSATSLFEIAADLLYDLVESGVSSPAPHTLGQVANSTASTRGLCFIRMGGYGISRPGRCIPWISVRLDHRPGTKPDRAWTRGAT